MKIPPKDAKPVLVTPPTQPETVAPLAKTEVSAPAAPVASPGLEDLLANQPLAPLAQQTAKPSTDRAAVAASTADLAEAKARLAALTSTIDGPPSGEIAKPYAIAFAAAEKFVSIGALLSSNFIVNTFTSELPSDPTARTRSEQRTQALKDLLGGGETKVAEQFLATAPAAVVQTAQALAARVGTAFSEFVRASTRSTIGKKKDTDIEIPSPMLVQLERATVGLSITDDMDVESLAIIVLSQCSRESDADLRELLGEMEASRKKKAAMRDELNAIKEMKASFTVRQGALDDQLVSEYNQRRALPESDPKHIPATKSFDDFKAETNIRVISGSLSAPPFDGQLGLGNETLFGYTPAPTPTPTATPTPTTVGASNTGGPAATTNTPIVGEDKVLQDALKLRDEDIRGLRAFYDAAPAPKGASFTAWVKGTDKGDLPSPSLSDPTTASAATATFLKEAADGTLAAANAGPEDTYSTDLATITKTWPTTSGDDWGAILKGNNSTATRVKEAQTTAENYGKTFLSAPLRPGEATVPAGSDPATLLTNLDSALRDYYRALAAQAWCARNDKDTGPAESEVTAALGKLTEAMTAFGPSRSQFASNYVSLRLEAGKRLESYMGSWTMAIEDGFWDYNNYGETYFRDAFDNKKIGGRAASSAHLAVPGEGTQFLNGLAHQTFSGLLLQAINSNDKLKGKNAPKQVPAWAQSEALKQAAARYPDAYLTRTSAIANTRSTIADTPSTIEPRPYTRPPFAADEISYRQMAATTETIEAEIAKKEGEIDTLTDLNAEKQTRLQLYMDRRAKFQSTLSNILKKASDTSASIIGNMK